MRHNFRTEQWLPYPVEQVFAFFADPANLPRLMPAWQTARIEHADFIAPPPPPHPFPGSNNITAGSGTRLTLSIRPIPFSPIRLPWVALIEDFRWLEGFCDVQLRGPFRYWRHCHTVQSSPAPTVDTQGQPQQPGTLLHDAVAYELPFGALGDLANRLLIQRQIASTFRFRQRRTLELLSASKTAL